MKLIYVHGINEICPSAADLKADWDKALFGQNKVDSEIVYWGDLSVIHKPRLSTLSDKFLCELLKLATANELLLDVKNYFYDGDMRQNILNRFRAKLEGHKEVVIVSHSLGTVVALDGILNNPNITVKKFITIGSPLALYSIKAELKRVNGLMRLEVPKNIKHWDNFSDVCDLVAANHFCCPAYGTNPIIQDSLVVNPNAPTNPHSILGYFKVNTIREDIIEALK